MDLLEIGKLLLAIITTLVGSRWWNIRQQRKKLETEVSVVRMRNVGEIVDFYTDHMSKMADKVVALEMEIMELNKKIINQHTENGNIVNQNK